MIVVLGSPRASLRDDGTFEAAGGGVVIAQAAVAGGATVEIAGRIGNDEPGDAVILDLTRRGIGHAALLRVGGLATRTVAGGAGPRLDGGDVELALRYLPGYSVVVSDELAPDALAAAADAATWAGAHLIVIGEPEPSVALPDASTVLRPPEGESEGAFASLVGVYAAALDRGVEPDRAFADLAGLFNPERVG